MERTAHAGGMRQFSRFAIANNIDLGALLDSHLRAIVEAAEDAESVPAFALVDILEICSALARRPDLGIAFGSSSSVRGYGPVSLVWDHAPNAAAAYRISQQYMHLETGALTTQLREHGDEAAIGYHVMVPAKYGAAQYLQANMAIGVALMRHISGRHWSPVRVEMACPAPQTLRFHKSVFRCPLEFGAEGYAVVYDKADLERPSPTANVHMFNYLERHLATLGNPLTPRVSERVEQIVVANLAGADVSLDFVSRRIGMSARSLQRQLAKEATSFGHIVHAVRRRIAQEYLNREIRPNLDGLAVVLGFADADGAGRFVRTAFGRSMRQFVYSASVVGGQDRRGRTPPSAQ